MFKQIHTFSRPNSKTADELMVDEFGPDWRRPWKEALEANKQFAEREATAEKVVWSQFGPVYWIFKTL